MNTSLPATYSNPLWNGYLADPFVLRHDGAYYAYGTGSSVGDELPEGRMFPLLRSTDLVNWECLGGALEPLASPASGKAPAYWAPEVAERDGTFFMYYSCTTDGAGSEDTQRLRVATASHPAGPFIDCGIWLLPEEGFTIDAHPFRDPRDGRWYLFFCKDFLDERAGTGIAVAPLQDDMKSFAGPIQTVLRASHDWQIFERNRPLYERTWDAWHTIEGAFVVPHDGLYFCLYSGGAWHTENYGVGYGVAEHPLGPWRDEWAHEGPSVLRGIPEKVLGPGHNSVILGPDGQTPFVVYHAWDAEKTARRLCIDPLTWTSDGRPRCLGPTTGPQPFLSTETRDASTRDAVEN